MSSKARHRLGYKLTYAAGHPAKIVPHLKRLTRDVWLRVTSGKDHLAYYRAVMKSDTGRNPEAAVGSQTHDRWLALGEMQFTYLLGHGLRQDARMLEIGCGNLRAGRLFIDYLDAGNYVGIDISPDILRAAEATIDAYGLRSKNATLLLVDDNRFDELPDASFDVINAHSVYSHCPIDVIDECFRHVGRIMKPNGRFDLTFNRTDGAEHHVLREDFYYRTQTLVDLAGRHGLSATFADDWELMPHGQSKLRITLSARTASQYLASNPAGQPTGTR